MDGTDRGRSQQESQQRLGLLLGVAGSVVLCVFFAADFHRAGRAPRIGLLCRINPNDAPVSSLLRLPGIGPARAKAIVAYRRTREGPAFRDAGDLLKVEGIGPRTVEDIEPFLEFE